MTKQSITKYKHIGWLLTSFAPANIEKGRRMLEEAPPEVRAKAEGHARELITLYRGLSSHPHIMGKISKSKGVH